MSNKKITSLNTNTTPSGSDVFPIVNNGETKQMSLNGLSQYLSYNLTGNTGVILSGVTYNDVLGVLTFDTNKNTQIILTGFTTDPGLILSGASYNKNLGVLTFDRNNNTDLILSGFTTNVKHFETNTVKTVRSDETIVIAGDYVLEDTNLTLEDESSIVIGSLTFNKYGQIFIGGNLLIKDSNIINNGLINVAGAVVFSGNSTITGTGKLI